MELRYRTAGESHGEGLTVFLEGVPFGFRWDQEFVDAQLARRQQGYGRSSRQKIEADCAKVLGGLKNGIAIGGPLAIWIGNRDYKIDRLGIPTTPRPGHADLAGAQKYETKDLRAIMERASARETAGRTVAGAVAASLLREFDIEVFAFVKQIGNVQAAEQNISFADAKQIRSQSAFFALDLHTDKTFREKIDEAMQKRDSLGGIVEVWIQGVPPGLGNYTSYTERFNAQLAAALFSIPTVKGVEFGLGFAAAARFGSQVQDEIVLNVGDVGAGPFSRRTNRLGGIEGGISNGQRIVLRAALKPIPTIPKGLKTIDLNDLSEVSASYERSDTCAVPAASVVAESVVAFAVAQAFLAKFQGDSLTAVRRSYESYCQALKDTFLPENL